MILIAVMLIGIGLILYPSVSDYWNSYHQTRAIVSYNETVSSIDTAAFEEMWEKASAYNETLLREDNRYYLDEEEEETYDSLLNITGTGIMSYVEIKKLNISLPIYHGTDESVLQIAIGHIPGTSLPVGGESTHCVISGHRGLPSARLFTEIDQLEKGDTFLVQTLGETLTYEVDQIRIVLPHELDDIEIEEGKDYCTLVTCTPYGINSHRLLVRGHRIENAKEHIHVTADAAQIDYRFPAIIIAAILSIIAGIVMMILSSLRRRA
ncbi:MAG: class C sortase [Solobacterium sp.]|nr:class C sortase [Solobacterium sp.]